MAEVYAEWRTLMVAGGAAWWQEVFVTIPMG